MCGDTVIVQIEFNSSHVTGDYSGGTLIIKVTSAENGQVSRQNEVFFTVPPDYHVHNDLVAAACMAFAGHGYREAAFNFPISTACADMLAAYYRLDAVSPVDSSLQARKPGRYLGLSFSGGLDSLGIWVLLREFAEIEFKVITAEYDRFYREATGYASYARDVSCHTNFRNTFHDRAGFEVVVPLLFADYADLYAFTTGHTFAHYPLIWNDFPASEPPEFVYRDAVAWAGGLIELHLARFLIESALLLLLVRAAPERVEQAFLSASGPGTEKYYAKAMMLRHIYPSEGLAIPAYLHDPGRPEFPARSGVSGLILLRQIFLWWIGGRRQAMRLAYRARHTDWSPLHGLALDFQWKYNPELARLIPDAFRDLVLAGLETHGIEPYSVQDFAELSAVRRFMIAANPPGSLDLVY